MLNLNSKIKNKILSAPKSTSTMLKRFAKNESGSFGVIFGLSLTALMLSAGVAVDYSRLSNARGVMDNALDTAVLSVGHEMSEGVTDADDLRAAFDAFLAANLAGRGITPENIQVASFSADVTTGQVTADVTGVVPMSIMSIAGIDEVTVGSTSQAIFSTNPVEIAMMLDVTGSMNDNDKIGSLKLAAVDAINTLLPNNNNGRVRVGLVPYSWSVNAGDYAVTVKDETTASNTGKCVTERGIDTYKDVSYQISPLEGHERATSDDRCPDSEIIPLTDNRTKLVNEIQGFNASGYTAGHLGIAWTYYMLSEKWQSLWSEEADPSDYGSGTKKIAILMTDGEFNTYYDGTPANASFGGQFSEANYAAKKTCEDMKEMKSGGDGIIIYSIAFDAPASAETTLQDCATPDDGQDIYYYSADNETELRAAFASIAASIKKLRLSR